MAAMTTQLAILTAPGRSALASVGLYGPEAWAVVQPLFRTPQGQALAAPPPLGRARLGRIDDDVVLIAVPGGFEIHCHGGPEVLRLLTERLSEQGAQQVEWRATIADEALRWLPYAPTLRTAGILLDQYHGAFRAAVARILDAWPDTTELQRLVEHVGVGRHLITPWRVVLAGAVNVGKSSLLNALAGFERAVVSPLPGTTRDLVRVPLALEGWPLEFVDTAGWRATEEPLEAQGIELARQELDAADLVLWLVDATAEQPLLPDRPALVVWNKIDLVPQRRETLPPGTLTLSARTGAGLSELLAVLLAALIPQPPQPGEAVPFTPEQQQAVLAAWAAAQKQDGDQLRQELSRYG
jgi:tRNA modification GTPase